MNQKTGHSSSREHTSRENVPSSGQIASYQDGCRALKTILVDNGLTESQQVQVWHILLPSVENLLNARASMITLQFDPSIQQFVTTDSAERTGSMRP